MAGERIDIVGNKYGRLTVTHYGYNDGKRSWWHCVCDCGKQVLARGDQLKSGNTSSCGCLRVDVRTTHGGRYTRLYRIWQGIKERCLNENSKDYPNYGGRGITIDPAWLGPDGFQHFADHIGQPPSPKHSIGRIDNDKGYQPGNVRWETAKEQARNRRNNRILSFNGKTQTVAQWADETGISIFRICERLDRSGWTIEQALTIPVKAA